MSESQLTRPLPGGVVCDAYTEFIMDRCPTLDEYDCHVPAMPVRTASHNPDAAGKPIHGWEHRSRAPGWVTHTIAVARKSECE